MSPNRRFDNLRVHQRTCLNEFKDNRDLQRCIKMNKKYLNMTVIGVVLCFMACVNLLLNINNILAFVQIVFGILFVVIGLKKIKK